MNWRLSRTQRPPEYEWTVEDWQDAEKSLWTALAFGMVNPPNVILYPKIRPPPALEGAYAIAQSREKIFFLSKSHFFSSLPTESLTAMCSECKH